MSFSQQRLWFINQFHQGQDRVYNIPVALRLEGELNVDALRYALNTLIERHESLRTTFKAIDGEAAQVIAPEQTLELAVIDVNEAELAAQVSRHMEHVFDLSQGPLFIAGLLRANADRHVLLLNMHHIISDRWSEGVMVREVAALYQAYLEHRPNPLPVLPVQYADFAYWQRQWLQGEVLEQQAAWWREALKDAPVLLELPTDRPRPATQTYHGAYEFFDIGAEQVAALKALSREADVTLFMVLLAAFKVLLARYARQDDIAVGTTIANRMRPELENLIGFFVNTLVLRSRVPFYISFSEYLRNIKGICLGAYDNQDVPFEYLLDVLQIPRRVSHSPLFQVVFNLHNAPQSEINLPGLKIASPGEASGKHTTAKFDLTFELFESSDRLRGRLEYNTDLFDRETIRRLIGHYRSVLEAIVTDPSQEIASLPLLTDEERRQVVHEWNARSADAGRPACLHEVFESWAARTPGAEAVVFEDQRLSYGELNVRANRLAHYLMAAGVVAETAVALCFERSIEMVVAILAVLKAGGYYVPLDPSQPARRLEWILEDSRAALLLTHSTVEAPPSATGLRTLVFEELEASLEGYATDNPAIAPDPDNLAYVIYTSGSTGRPKGVMVTHANVHRLFGATRDQFEFSEQDTWCLFHSYAFDFSVWELWGALFHGGNVRVVPYWMSRTPEEFYRFIDEHGITVLNQTPSAFAQLLSVDGRERRELPALRYIIFGGEKLDFQGLKPWFENHGEGGAQLVNMYGITETTVHVTAYRLTGRDANTAASIVGVALDDLQTYILDEALQPVPVGVSGELYVGGAGLARGYAGRPGLTAARFVPDPFGQHPGQRLYRSGDRARYRADGTIEYIDRMDNQVQLRGFRIELGEIEHALRQQEGVGEAVVSVYRPAAEQPDVLVAYVVNEADEMDAGALRGALKAMLPDYMVPAYYVELDALPLTANGKVDRKALPAPDAQALSRREYIAPTTPAEQVLVEIWADVLKLPAGQVGIHDNFFELGGHSLLAIQVITKVQQRTSIYPPLKLLFEKPTIAALAEFAEAYLMEQDVFGEPARQAEDAEVERGVI